MIIVVRSVFQECEKYFPQVLSNEHFMNYKCKNIIRQIIQKELMLIRQMHQKNVKFIIFGLFLERGFKYKPYLYNGCHDLIENDVIFNDVSIVFVTRSD